MRILCSKIRELCCVLMLTIYASYAPEICDYASKQNNFLGHKNTFSHRTVTKHIERLQNSRIEAKCHQLVTLVVLQHQRCLNVVLECTILTLQPGPLRSAIVFLSGHMETAHAQYAQGYKITKLCWHNAQCFEGSIMLKIMPA